jgi:hypothetical protein
MSLVKSSVLSGPLRYLCKIPEKNGFPESIQQKETITKEKTDLTGFGGLSQFPGLGFHRCSFFRLHGNAIGFTEGESLNTSST